MSRVPALGAGFAGCQYGPLPSGVFVAVAGIALCCPATGAGQVQPMPSSVFEGERGSITAPAQERGAVGRLCPGEKEKQMGYKKCSPGIPCYFLSLSCSSLNSNFRGSKNAATAPF